VRIWAGGGKTTPSTSSRLTMKEENFRQNAIPQLLLLSRDRQKEILIFILATGVILAIILANENNFEDNLRIS
jgi:hypothetical protein